MMFYCRDAPLLKPAPAVPQGQFAADHVLLRPEYPRSAALQNLYTPTAAPDCCYWCQKESPYDSGQNYKTKMYNDFRLQIEKEQIPFEVLRLLLIIKLLNSYITGFAIAFYNNIAA